MTLLDVEMTEVTEVDVEFEDTLDVFEVESEVPEVDSDVPRAVAACLVPSRATAVKLEKP